MRVESSMEPLTEGVTGGPVSKFICFLFLPSQLLVGVRRSQDQPLCRVQRLLIVREYMQIRT